MLLWLACLVFTVTTGVRSDEFIFILQVPLVSIWVPLMSYKNTFTMIKVTYISHISLQNTEQIIPLQLQCMHFKTSSGGGLTSLGSMIGLRILFAASFSLPN